MWIYIYINRYLWLWHPKSLGQFLTFPSSSGVTQCPTSALHHGLYWGFIIILVHIHYQCFTFDFNIVISICCTVGAIQEWHVRAWVWFSLSWRPSSPKSIRNGTPFQVAGFIRPCMLTICLQTHLLCFIGVQGQTVITIN